MQFPKDLLLWIEGHPGLASWIQAIGVLITLWLTYHVASHDRRERMRERGSYRSLLKVAFSNLREPLSYLYAIPVTAPAHDSSLAEGTTEETARQMNRAILRMQDIHTAITRIGDVARLDDFDLISAILNAQSVIELAKPTFVKETNWLSSHGGSEAVVNSAVNTLASRAAEIIPAIDKVLQALENK